MIDFYSKKRGRDFKAPSPLCLPSLAAPCHAAPGHATPCLPRRVSRPVKTCLALHTPCPACRALPCQASPCLAVPGLPRLARPSPALPRPAETCLLCYHRFVNLCPNRCEFLKYPILVLNRLQLSLRLLQQHLTLCRIVHYHLNRRVSTVSSTVI